jgi:hypothetical protein
MYFYFGGDNLLILGLFFLASLLCLLLGFGAIFFSVKILLVLNKIKEYIKRRGDK